MAFTDPNQGEYDHGTLSRAEEIKSDPKRMKAVKVHHRKAMKGMAGIARALGRKR